MFLMCRNYIFGGTFKNFGKIGKYWTWGLLKIKMWNELLLDNYQIVHYYNRMPLIPLADYSWFMCIPFLPKSTSFPQNTNRTASLRDQKEIEIWSFSVSELNEVVMPIKQYVKLLVHLLTSKRNHTKRCIFCWSFSNKYGFLSQVNSNVSYLREIFGFKTLIPWWCTSKNLISPNNVQK